MRALSLGIFAAPCSAGERGPYAKHCGRVSTIGRLRRAAELTQAKAAKQAGVSLRTFQRAEAGDAVPHGVVRQIERSLGVKW